MELEPKSLGIPLYRRDWSALWFALASAGCAWLWHRPTNLPDILVTCLLGGFAFWLSLGPGLNQLKYHHSRLVRACFFIASLAGVFVVMEHLVPMLSSYVTPNP